MNTWMNNPQYLAQIGHFFGAYSIVITAYMILGPHWFYVAIALFLYAVVKEFWWDMVYELPKQTWGDSIMDFVFYMLGMGSASLVVKVFA